MNPIDHLAGQHGRFVLDGGLATALEAKGHKLDDPLWSARMILDEPAAIREVHTDFLQAGADCIISASYQATVAGFEHRGLSHDEAIAAIRRSLEIAIEARDAFWRNESNRPGRPKPLVAASVGPYGAYLADGSEYRGDYDLGACGLYAFHRERWLVLAESGADVLACETIPSTPEATALLRLLDETPGVYAWLSFSCRDDRCLNDGTTLKRIAAACDTVDRVAAVGINCTAPACVTNLIDICRAVTTKPIIVYPNSGERYERGAWSGETPQPDWAALAREWAAAGAVGIGGCCRVGPAQIAAVRGALS